MSKVNVITTIEINTSLEKLADFVFNPDNAPNWYVNIKSVEWKTQKPLQIGTQIAFKAEFLGKKMEYTYAFVDLIKNKKLVMQTAEGPFPMQTTYEISQIGENKVLMKLQNEGEPSGFSKIMTPFMTMMMRKANRKDLQLLKKVMEKE